MTLLGGRAMGNLRYIFALAVAAAALSTSSFAQTTAPGQGPPRTQVPPSAPQIRPPTAQVRPNLTLAPQTIPVIIAWGNGRFTGGTMPAGVATGGASYPEADHDGDGERAISHGGLDCDDNDRRRAPARTEQVDPTGHDEDCNYMTIPPVDADFDGFVSWQAMNILRDGNGRPLAVVRGPDCDDSWADTNPGQPEVVGDLRDNNCDGEIDVIRAGGHREYCPPTDAVAVANALPAPCGQRRGDTSQWGGQ
jgi:hypothetical protein